MATARVIQAVVDDVSAYLGTITFINACLGLFVAFWLWMVGMPYPLMWGGVIALLKYIPYYGPIVAALLMALGGLMTFTDICMALVPPAMVIGCNLVESTEVTTLIVGDRKSVLVGKELSVRVGSGGRCSIQKQIT